MQRDAPALRHPFLTFEFARAIDEVSKHARVVVVEEAGETVGFLAYNSGAMNVARPIGGRLSYRQGFVHAEGLRWSWPELMRSAGIHAIELTNLVGSQAATGDGLVVRPSPIIDTSLGWDAYLEQGRRHNHIRKTLKRGRRLERTLGPVEFTWGPVRSEEFAQLIAWKSQQYRRSGWPDPFARPWIRDALDVLREHRDGDLEVVFTTLRARGDLLAVDLSLRYQDVLALWFSAYNHDYADYSPGAIRRMRAIQRACEEHLAYVDLARGDEPYKQSFKNADLPVATGLLQDHSASALLYRSIHTPYNGTRSWILRQPRARAFVRSSLRHLGSVRVRVHPHQREHHTAAAVNARPTAPRV